MGSKTYDKYLAQVVRIIRYQIKMTWCFIKNTFTSSFAHNDIINQFWPEKQAEISLTLVYQITTPTSQPGLTWDEKREKDVKWKRR